MSSRKRPAMPGGRNSPPAITGDGRQGSDRNDLRAGIAHLCARLIAEGLSDYHSAKLKAARQLGVVDGRVLPDDREIESALREHYALFSRDNQSRTLSRLRDAAVEAMLRLAHFSPWLTGAVLNGSANEHNEIELELIGVDAKEFEVFLLNAGHTYKICDSRPNRGSAPSRHQPGIAYRVDLAGVPVCISLFENHACRQAAYPRGSQFHDRAQLAEVKKRFAAEA
jgi:hypothetical protein